MIDSGSLYFLLLTAGLAVGMAWFVRTAERRGHPRVLLIDVCLACLLGTIVGSRALYVATEPLPSYAVGGAELDELSQLSERTPDAELSGALQRALASPPVAMPWLFVARMPEGGARSEAIRRAEQDVTAVPARLWFRAYPFEALAFWKGGLVYLGGVVGAVACCVLVIVRRDKRLVAELADVSAPAIHLGTVLGRLGCVVSGCCYGAVCEPHWWSTPPPWLIDVLGSDPRYPTAFMLLILSGLSFFLLRALLARRVFAGEVFLAMLVLYGVGRFAVEIVRADPRGRWIGNLTTSQVISLATALPAGLLWAWGRQRAGPRDAPGHSAQDAPDPDS